MNAKPVDQQVAALWRFGVVEFDERRWELRVGGRPVALERKPLEVLGHLLRHAGQAVGKSELLERVWGDRIVVEGALTNAVGKLRKAIGDDGQTVLVTVPKVGYRLQADVEQNPEPRASVRARRPSVYPATAVLMVAAVFMAFSLVAYLITPWQGWIPHDSLDQFTAAEFIGGLSLMTVSMWRIRKTNRWSMERGARSIARPT